MTSLSLQTEHEWLETDGRGGFAMGTASGIRTRRYHGLLMGDAPEGGGEERFLLVNGVDAHITLGGETHPLSTQRYAPGVLAPEGLRFLVSFTHLPWPTWTFLLPGDVTVVHDLFIPQGGAGTVLSWRLTRSHPDVTLTVRPFLSGRDFHALHSENDRYRFDAVSRDQEVRWAPYDGVPGVVAAHTGVYRHDPLWYRRFEYPEELARGFDGMEDLAAPGAFTFSLSRTPSLLVFAPADARSATRPDAPSLLAHGRAEARRTERARRRASPTALHRAAAAYLVRRGTRDTIIAGYPWFGDWGRDTFIALRGFCLATGNLDRARAILLAWSDLVSDGMLPNRFLEHGAEPEYHSADAALWYVIDVYEYLDAVRRGDQPGHRLPAADRRRLLGAAVDIVERYAAGTRHRIGADEDGLLAAGVQGLQMTWMDAKIGDWVVTPRVGKPVELQALWLNALHLAGRTDRRWAALSALGRAAFRRRFWNADRGSLFDVVDVDHVRGTVDARIRPNQILALGGLPLPILDPASAEAIALLGTVTEHLVTPLGLRSLAPGEEGYCPRYEGGPRARDGAYHQGTVWPWLTGPYVDAWIRVHGDSARVRRDVRRVLRPLRDHLRVAGLGHVSEIADGDPPHTPRGCPFQAWSVSELLRVTLAYSAR